MNELARYGIIGLFFALVGSGSTLLLDQGELQHAYVCDMTQEVGIFYGGISGTQYTGYPNELDRKSPTYCKHPESGVKGKWIPCEEYASAHGKSCAEQIAASTDVSQRDIVLRQEITDRDGNHVFVVCVEEGRYFDEGLQG